MGDFFSVFWAGWKNSAELTKKPGGFWLYETKHRAPGRGGPLAAPGQAPLERSQKIFLYNTGMDGV